jgi:hypothetical protein
MVNYLNTLDSQIALVDELIERKDKNSTATFTAWLDLRDSITLLYHKIARLYPDPIMRNAFNRMADMLDNNQDIIILSNRLFA